VVDFDHHSASFHADRHALWADLRRRCPVAYNPRYGGFWVVSGYDEVAQVARDAVTFSSYYGSAEDGIDYLGITGIPRARGIPPAGIAEVEGPLHQALRRVINSHLLPPAVARLRPFMTGVVTWFIDQVVGSGAMDVVEDLTGPVAAVTTLHVAGLPCAQWRRYAEMFHGTVAYRAGGPEHRAALAHVPAMVDELLAEAADRRRRPRGDLISELATLEVGGLPLTDEQLSAVLWNLVAGGLDTTTSLTAMALFHLSEHPADRQALASDPALLTTATEEFLRVTSVNETLTRTVTRPVELGGQRLERGDRVMISWVAANHDDQRFPDPERVALDRSPNPHLAFGVGPHRCIGMHVARALFAVMVGEVLRRLPDYRVDAAATRFYDLNPELAGVVTMPATFTPGPVAGPPSPPF
jgi:cytochrome P450